MSKYDVKKPGVFNDPVVRCYGCQKILDRKELSHVGSCKFCGSRRVSALQKVNGKEMKLMAKWGVDPDFLALFAPMEGVDND